jgi:hypothetical protein
VVYISWVEMLKEDGIGDRKIRRDASQRNNLMAVRARMNADTMLFSDSRH